jgi:hypothetical protein
MAILFPLSLLAADTGSAIVHSNGGVRVTGAEVPDSTTVFAGDLLETKPGFMANLETEGSSVLIQGESVAKFQGNYLPLEHGSVSVGTSTWNERPRGFHQGGTSGQRPDTKRPDTIRCDGRERDGTGGGSKE